MPGWLPDDRVVGHRPPLRSFPRKRESRTAHAAKTGSPLSRGRAGEGHTSGQTMTRVGWIRLLVVVLAVGMLELACRLGAIDHRVVIPPSEMAIALYRMFAAGQFSAEMARTFGIVVAAVAISIV